MANAHHDVRYYKGSIKITLDKDTVSDLWKEGMCVYLDMYRDAHNITKSRHDSTLFSVIRQKAFSASRMP